MSTCIITGASSGIGRATAIEFSKRRIYDSLVLIGRDQKKLSETIAYMSDTVEIEKVEFDLKDIEEIPSLISNIYQKKKSIDALLNIAGYADPQPLMNMSIESIRLTYEVNIFSTLVLTKECARYMKNLNKTAIVVNVASTAGSGSRPGWVVYSSSKAAMISISQTLSEELAEYGIKVYCISPGRCATPLRQILAPSEDPNSIMQPDIVGRIICDLLSENGEYLDGQNIIVRKRN